jgi:D-sedoheptulose 7-phosphate isomerase
MKNSPFVEKTLSLQELMQTSISQSIEAVSCLQSPTSTTFMEKAAHMLAKCFQAGNKVILAGNGGSLCDANHFAEELTGIFRKLRPALPAIALSESGHITCTANDIGFEWVFSRGVEAYGKPGDLFVGLTTSGNSPNILRAFETAKARGLNTVAFLGKGGGKAKGIADLELIINGFSTSDRIQEAHMASIHIIIEMVELLLFGQDKKKYQQDAQVPNGHKSNGQ